MSPLRLVQSAALRHAQVDAFCEVSIVRLIAQLIRYFHIVFAVTFRLVFLRCCSLEFVKFVHDKSNGDPKSSSREIELRVSRANPTLDFMIVASVSIESVPSCLSFSFVWHIHCCFCCCR